MIVLPRTRSQNGIIPNAATVLTKVIVIDRLISPLSRRHQKFDPVPPGQQPRTLEIIIPSIYKTSESFCFRTYLYPLTFEFLNYFCYFKFLDTEWNSAQKLKKVLLQMRV